ncbi:MAG: response regulator [Ignavibacteria bacterium]|jgi:response regulator RpfG family c-di-GMP phosphodiesterase|nr:response regulator [Ignavibacteria bacterium]MCU7504914.1 response regulator [Ignavibacteria bacterium]MCU7517794.1 response regulator [Ignavibacteria bacterium]
MNYKILFVDDEKNVLSGYERNLRLRFEVVCSQSALEAVEIIRKAEENKDPFAVVISDYRMPEMDGNKFLSLSRQIAPNSVRVMLTGYAEVHLAIEAVNEGNVFRFLTKPCSNEKLLLTLKAAAEQYRLIVAEKELLDKTLKGSIKVLVDILSIANPVAFSRAGNILKIAKRLSGNLDPDLKWQVEIAALLSQIGCIAVPEEILHKKRDGQTLSLKEKELFLSHPQVGKSLIKNIPRLEDIAESISFQFKKFTAIDFKGDGRHEERVAIIARILKHANDLNTLIEANRSEAQVLAEFQTKYDSEFETDLEIEKTDFEKNYAPKNLLLKQLLPGMILRHDIIDKNGLALVAQGQELSEAMILKLMSFAQLNRIIEPIPVYVPRNEEKMP